MGMFDSIHAELECPETKKSENQEIQIKWREHKYRVLDVFHTGEVIENICAEYDNTWIRTDYVCRSCTPSVRVEDQRRHFCYIRIEDSRVIEVLSEEDFSKLGIEKFVVYE